MYYLPFLWKVRREEKRPTTMVTVAVSYYTTNVGRAKIYLSFHAEKATICLSGQDTVFHIE